MKKSQLRNIIKESVKQLLTEQVLPGCTNTSVYGCGSRTLLNPNGQSTGNAWGVYDYINQNHGPNSPFESWYTLDDGVCGMSSIGWCPASSGGNCCDFTLNPGAGRQYMKVYRAGFGAYGGYPECGLSSAAYAYSFQELVDTANQIVNQLGWSGQSANYQWTNITLPYTTSHTFHNIRLDMLGRPGALGGYCQPGYFYTYCCGGGSTPPPGGCMDPTASNYDPTATTDCAGYVPNWNAIPGPYGDTSCCGAAWNFGCLDSNAYNYDPTADGCDDGTGIADPNNYDCCDFGWRCKQLGNHPKFGHKCVPGNAQNPGPFPTIQDCQSQAPCAILYPDKSKTITPFTTDPQSKMAEPDDEFGTIDPTDSGKVTTGQWGWACDGGNCYRTQGGQYYTQEDCAKYCGKNLDEPLPPKTEPTDPESSEFITRMQELANIIK